MVLQCGGNGVLRRIESEALVPAAAGFPSHRPIERGKVARESFVERMARVTPGVGVSLRYNLSGTMLNGLSRAASAFGVIAFPFFQSAPRPVRLLYELGNDGLTGQALYRLVGQQGPDVRE